MSENTQQLDEMLDPETGLNLLNQVRINAFLDGMSKRGYDISTQDELMQLLSLGEVLAEKEASVAAPATSVSKLAEAALAANGVQKAASNEEGLPADMQNTLYELAQQPGIYLSTLSYGTSLLQSQGE